MHESTLGTGPISSTVLTQHLLEAPGEYAIFVLNVDGVIAGWSGGGERLTGFPAGEIVGRPLPALWAGDDREPDEILRAAREAGFVSGERWLRRRDGSSFWAVETVSAVRSGEALSGFAVIVRDVTERRRREEATRLSQATFEGILEIASDAVVCVSEDQRITFFNNGAESIFGYTPEEVLRRPLEILIPEPSRPDHARQVREFAASGGVPRRMGERGEIRGRRKDGSIFPAEASISMLDVEGTRVFTAVLRDVTERRQAEEAIAASNEELARSNAELEQFAYVASHDLQEPLRMVASYTQLLARRYRGRLDEDADEFIGYAVEGVNRMQALINDLLAYSRVGTRGGEMGPVEMNTVLERVLQSLGPAIEEAEARVTSGPLPIVAGDPGQFVQLLQNLIGNAIKFRGEAPPRVHVSAEPEDGMWKLSVRDNGIGLAPEFRDRIFVIFQRLHSRAEYPGTGIGLSICRKIVERHGGRIWVESEVGHGATFHFTLPAHDGS